MGLNIMRAITDPLGSLGWRYQDSLATGHVVVINRSISYIFGILNRLKIKSINIMNTNNGHAVYINYRCNIL